MIWHWKYDSLTRYNYNRTRLDAVWSVRSIPNEFLTTYQQSLHYMLRLVRIISTSASQVLHVQITDKKTLINRNHIRFNEFVLNFRLPKKVLRKCWRLEKEANENRCTAFFRVLSGSYLRPPLQNKK